MSYTNGFNKEKVLPKLFGRLGWMDSSLNAANRESRSGRYFDDGTFHALVSVPSIKATHRATDWDAFFTSLQNAAIAKCMSGVFNEPSYMDNRVLLYDRLTNNDQKLPNEGRFCGVEIRVAPSRDIAVQLDSVTLYFDGAHTFPLYLFRGGNVAPIKEIEVTTEANEQTVIDLENVILKYPGTYYLGYFQSDLGVVKAIREEVKWNRTYCFNATSITAVETGDDFNRNAISYTSQPHGLNVQASSFADFTERIMTQAFLFDEALGLVMAQMVMEGEFFSTLSNGTERQLKESAKAAVHLELQGALPIPDSPHVEGVRVRIKKELAAVKGNFFKGGKAQNINLC